MKKRTYKKLREEEENPLRNRRAKSKTTFFMVNNWDES